MANSRKSRQRPATTPEARENQLISLAIDLAEKQLIEGTASAQVITHYLKLGSTKERLEKELMEKQKDFVTAKTESIRITRQTEEENNRKYQEVLDALRLYNGKDE